MDGWMDGCAYVIAIPSEYILPSSDLHPSIYPSIDLYIHPSIGRCKFPLLNGRVEVDTTIEEEDQGIITWFVWMNGWMDRQKWRDTFDE